MLNSVFKFAQNEDCHIKFGILKNISTSIKFKEKEGNIDSEANLFRHDVSPGKIKNC